MASVLFLLFGLWLLFDGALGLRVAAVVATGAVVVAVAVTGLVGLRRRRKAAPSLESPSLTSEPSAG